MLFCIESDVQDLLVKDPTPSESSHAVDLLCLSASEGKHRVTARRDILRSLSVNPALQTKSRAVLANALSFVESDLALQRTVSVFGSVSLGGYNVRAEIVNGQRIIRIPLKWIDDSLKVQATILLGENLIDAELLEKLVAVVRHIDDSLSLPIRARLQGGGGNTTAQVFEHIVQSGRFCVCVVDSDKKAPNGPIGDTARALSHCDHLSHPIGAVAHTEGRELENALPDWFYESLYGNDVNHGPTIAALQAFAHAGDVGLRLHIDVNKGLTLRDVFQQPQGSPARDFWNQKLNIVAAAVGKNLDEFPCRVLAACGNPANCKCRLMNGNSDDVLRRFIEFCSKAGTDAVAQMLDATTRKECGRLARLVFDWCCSSDRLRS